ncbi:NUDIX hydrolase [Taklimakanibacter deserti]|uniref:NUDIX hydrolase n=1 Tax=Taklimakanibacter deserti TaxID=2267839 RepID=UPI000E64BFD8
MPRPKSRATEPKAKAAVGVLVVSTRKPGKILLVTSRRSKSWTLPKGHVDRILGLAQSARREAFEEAGVLGRMTTMPIGSYSHRKSSGGIFRVRVFKMHIRRELSRWPEKKERQRRWASSRSVLKLVANPSLRRFIKIQLGVPRG